MTVSIKREELTQEKLKELLHYDPDTGVFTWKERDRNMFKSKAQYMAFQSRCANKKAGTKNLKCNTIILFKKQYLSRRIAWLYVYGSWPKNDLDNIDGDVFNDAIKNLREATRADHRNKAIRKKPKKYLQGVCLNISTNKKKRYQASLEINNKAIFLGMFATEQEAHNAYVEAKRQISPEFCML